MTTVNSQAKLFAYLAGNLRSAINGHQATNYKSVACRAPRRAAYQATVGAYEAWDLALYAGPVLLASHGTLNCCFSCPACSDPAYLAAVGLSCALISTSRAVGFLPFLCKFAFSFISECVRCVSLGREGFRVYGLPFCSRFNFFGWGWRRPYITLGLVCSAVCFFILTAIPPRESFALYVIVSVLRNSAISLADGGAEGLSVDAGVEASSGALQAWSMAGRALGMMLWAAAGGYIAERSGYAACLAAVGAFVLCCVPGGWFVKVRDTLLVLLVLTGPPRGCWHGRGARGMSSHAPSPRPLPPQEERQALRSSAEGYVAAEADRFVNVSAAAEPSEPRGGPVFSTAALTASFLPAVVLPEPTAPAYETGIKGPQAESIYPAPQQQLPTGSHADATRAYVQFDGPGRLTETAGGMTFSEQVRPSWPNSAVSFHARACPPRSTPQARVVFMQTQDPAITCFLAWTFLSTLGAVASRGCASPKPATRRVFMQGCSSPPTRCRRAVKSGVVSQPRRCVCVRVCVSLCQ